MESKRNGLDFDVLGLNIKLKAGDDNNSVNPEEVIQLVRAESEKIFASNPTLAVDKVAVLVALKLAEDKLKLDKEYRENIEKLHVSAEDALQYIEEVSPTTV